MSGITTAFTNEEILREGPSALQGRLVSIRYITPRPRNLLQYTGPAKFIHFTDVNKKIAVFSNGKRSWHLVLAENDFGGRALYSVSKGGQLRRINDDCKPVIIYRWITDNR